jgi:hypothetical protein
VAINLVKIHHRKTRDITAKSEHRNLIVLRASEINKSATVDLSFGEPCLILNKNWRTKIRGNPCVFICFRDPKPGANGINKLNKLRKVVINSRAHLGS